MGAGGVEVDRGGLFAGFGKGAGGEEGAADAGGIGAMGGSELAVAGGEGEAVGFPDGGVADDFDREIEVPDHAADESELLEVLVSEDGGVRADDVEELEDDGEDAIEVAGSGGSAEVGGEEGLGNEGGVVLFVERGGFGDEGDIGSFGRGEGEIVFERAGVGAEVLGAVELDGVDEDGNDDGAFRPHLLPGGAEKSEVTFVEGAHGGDEGDLSGPILEVFLNRVDVRVSKDH